MKVTRTATGLRDSLFDLLDELRSGAIKPSMAKAQCEVARHIMETVKMESNELAVLRTSLAIDRWQRERPALPAGEVE